MSGPSSEDVFEDPLDEAPEDADGDTWYVGVSRPLDAGNEPVAADDARDLPHAMAARENGFEVAPDAPLWLFLPAVWPAAHRTWIRDNRVRSQRAAVDGDVVDLPWSTADYLDMEAHELSVLRALGLPPRPAGRVWLLRPPPGCRDLDDTLRRVTDAAHAAGVPTELTREFVDHVVVTLRTLFEPA
ncbi:hypothetical protein GCM10009867_14020 [Pedococcus aerophilus]|uniref:Uncharacterized protein n=1 Tax=Pedococcus aerophilus TaxID=436356 RepID=A0ABN3UK23_9MICO